MNLGAADKSVCATSDSILHSGLRRLFSERANSARLDTLKHVLQPAFNRPQEFFFPLDPDSDRQPVQR
jgi:hypothetical protein